MCDLNIGTKERMGIRIYIHFTGLPWIRAYMPSCLSIGMLCCVCLDWGWGISLGPCCGWTCLSPLFWSETLIISLVRTVITLALFWTGSTSLPRPQSWARDAVDLHGQEPSKSILEMEAEGDVTCRYASRSMCSDYGPWCSLCPSLTGIMHKANVQSYLFTSQTHAWHCKTTEINGETAERCTVA